MGSKLKPTFAPGLQKAVVALMNGGLLWEKQFPELLTPIKVVKEPRKGKEKDLPRKRSFLVKVGVRSNFSPNELWLKFNRKGTSILVSPDKKDWLNISRFAKT